MIKLLEDPDDYRAFEQAVTADYDAETAVERELVLRLASLLWRLRRATAIETGLLQIQCKSSTAPDPDPALSKLPEEVGEVIQIFQSGDNSSGRELARCFLRLADLDMGFSNGLAAMRRRSGARSDKRFSRCNTCSGARRAVVIGEP